jgi:hypothetical protein
MRVLLVCFLLASFIGGCMNGNNNGVPVQSNAITDSSQFTTVQWQDSVKDFGKIQEGQKLEVSFRYKNVGDKPLVIQHVQASCGCTVAEQSTEPVPPGADGLVKATFNSQGHIGINHKTLTVTANMKGSQTHALQFMVEVEKKP